MKRLILAVDDDPSVCSWYEKSLPPLGYEVLCAASARQAKEVLVREKPDVILMDIMIPDQDGISLTKEIRSDPSTSHIPVIAVSILGDPATLNDALLFGAMDYMVKPIELETLHGKIERAIRLAEARKA